MHNNKINNPSFSLQIKEEIIKKDFKKCCKRHLILAIIKNNNLIFEDKLKVSLSSETLNKYFKEYVIDLFDNIDIVSHEKKQNKYLSYNNELTNCKEIINLLLDNKNTIPNQTHCKRAYVAGLFINSGSISSPNTSYYHLEIIFKQEKELDFFKEIISEFNFYFKTTFRNNNFVAYLKKSNTISDFLKFIDASKGVLEFENQRIERDFVNNINRLNNMDVYNLQKTIKASENQIEIINFLKKTGNFDLLNNKLKILCNIRIIYPEANLRELTIYMQELYNIKISRAGVNHLFRNLSNIYNKIK